MHETFFAITPKEKLCFFTDGQYLPSITLGATRMVFPVELLSLSESFLISVAAANVAVPKSIILGHVVLLAQTPQLQEHELSVFMSL